MVYENPDSFGGLAKNLPVDPIMTPVKAILFKPMWLLGRFYSSFLSNQSSSWEPAGFQMLLWLYLALVSVCAKPKTKQRSLYPEFIACHTSKLLEFWLPSTVKPSLVLLSSGQGKSPHPWGQWSGMQYFLPAIVHSDFPGKINNWFTSGRSVGGSLPVCTQQRQPGTSAK